MRETGRALAEIELAHLDEIERLHGRVAQQEAGQAGATPPARVTASRSRSSSLTAGAPWSSGCTTRYRDTTHGRH